VQEIPVRRTRFARLLRAGSPPAGENAGVRDDARAWAHCWIVPSALSRPTLRYHVSVRSLAQHVLSQIRQQDTLHAGDRVGVAVSGGIDSIALLRLLLELRQELGIVVSVVHFNHKLRGAESEADQEFVAALAREHGLEFYCSGGDVADLAAEQHSGLEAAAREMRYEFFRQLLAEGTPQGLKPQPYSSPGGAAESRALSNQAFSRHRLDKIATGHTLDDQAETVLMRVIRGTGMRGLGGIYPRVVVTDDEGEECGEIVRPLLGIRRLELQQYLSDLNLINTKQPWREDSTNVDLKFTRNRMRQLVLPLLEREFNPAVVESLAELAEIARDEEDYWENEVSGWLGTVVQWPDRNSTASRLVQILPSAFQEVKSVEDDAVVKIPGEADDSAELHEVPRFARDDKGSGNISLSRPWLLTEPRAVQRRVVKAIGEEAGIPLEFKHVEEILRFSAEEGSSGKELSLPLGWRVSRQPEAIVFLAPDPTRQKNFSDYEYALSIPGRAAVSELGVVIEALRLAPGAELTGYNPQQLLRDLLPAQVLVRNWRPGDRFWPAHSKAPKKVKELLQERHLAQIERKLWPVVLNGNEIVWMRGFPVPAKLQAKKDEGALLIREMPWREMPWDDAI
jgi:tRNA(Ile)-lysidine synthase